MGVLNMLERMTGAEFEKLCSIVVKHLGFEAEVTKVSGDGGIDILAHNNNLLVSGKYVIQCKRYKGSVGEPVVRDLYGVVMSRNANKGILMTTGSFTKAAVDFAKDIQIELVDGKMFGELCQKCGVNLGEYEYSKNADSSSNSLQMELGNYFNYSEMKREIERYPNDYSTRSLLIDRLCNIYLYRHNFIIENREQLWHELMQNYRFFDKIPKDSFRMKCYALVCAIQRAQLFLVDGVLDGALEQYYLCLSNPILKKDLIDCITEDEPIFVYSDIIYRLLFNEIQICNILGLPRKSVSIIQKYNRLFDAQTEIASSLKDYDECRRYLEFMKEPHSVIGFFMDDIDFLDSFADSPQSELANISNTTSSSYTECVYEERVFTYHRFDNYSLFLPNRSIVDIGDGFAIEYMSAVFNRSEIKRKYKDSIENAITRFLL